MRKHRELLAQEFQDVLGTRDKLQEMLDKVKSTDESDSKLPSIIEINRWESEVLDQVRQTAKKLRDDVLRISREDVSDIRTKFEAVSSDIDHKRRRDVYLENDLKSIRDKLSQLKLQTNGMHSGIQVTKRNLDKLVLESLVSISRNTIKVDVPTIDAPSTPQPANEKSKASGIAHIPSSSQSTERMVTSDSAVKQ